MTYSLKNLAAVYKAEAAYSKIMHQIIRLEDVHISKGLYTGLQTGPQMQLLEILRAEATSLIEDLYNAMTAIDSELDNLRNYEAAPPAYGEAPHTAKERERADYVVKTTIDRMLVSYDRANIVWLRGYRPSRPLPHYDNCLRRRIKSAHHRLQFQTS